jgi:hypothetical protein
MCNQSGHGSACECDHSTEWSTSWRALWVTFIVAVPGAFALFATTYYKHLVRMAAEKASGAMVTHFGTSGGYFEEAMFYMSFTLSVWLSTLVCLLAPFGEWIWKRNNFRSRKTNLLTWKNITAYTFMAEIALGFFWPYLTIEVGGSGPLGGFFAALSALFLISVFLIWRYSELKAWCGLLLSVALVGTAFCAVQSISAERAPRPSMGHLMRYVYYA